MKKLLTNLAAGALIVASAIPAMAQGQLLAFPGAEGFGRYATGGRGGEIYHVTNLNDSGKGSLRDAVSGTNRIIVFDVSGTIYLKSTLIVKGNNTILGQTAPGEGIQVYGNRVSFSNASNLIVRHMRFRMGIGGDSGKDAAGVASGHDMIFDHMSVLWGRDENFSISSNDKTNGPKNITIQNSIIGQGLQSHSCGGLIQSDNGITLYRNLYIENKTRNPKVKGLNQYVNNVVYNWGQGGCYIMSGSEGDSFADIENNYFMHGPWNGATKPFTRGTPTFRYYGAGNYYDNDKDGTINGHLMTLDEMKGQSSDGIEPYSTWFESLEKLNEEIAAYNTQNATEIQPIAEIVNKMSAADALAWVSENAGASLPVSDEVDKYLLDELKSWGKEGTKNGITSEKTLPHKGTGVLSGGVKPLDTDGDGIPDEWEKANGLNPNDASDAAAIAANGYANIENYVFTITEAYPYIKKPVSLTATDQTKVSVKLTWGLNGNNNAGFIVESSTDGKAFTEAGRVAAGVSEYTVEGLTPVTSYWFRVRAFNNDGLYSDFTDVVATETIGDPAAPVAATNPFPAQGAKEGIANGLTLTWEDLTPNFNKPVTYTVYLGEDEASMQQVATGLTKAEYAPADLQANKSYCWRVDATNAIGTTTGAVWTFSTTAGGVLFYTDFNTKPQGWADKYGAITGNTNVMNAANTTVSVGGMTFGSGAEAIRIVAMNEANMSQDGTQDYGPATADDAGASARCVQFVTTKAGGYLTLPAVEGPGVITMYLGNPDKSAKTVKLNTIVGGQETTVADLSLGAAKRIYKVSYTYRSSGTVTFKIDANAKKFNINDIIIERWIPQTGELPLELTSNNLVTDNMSYADGTLSLVFNQDIVYNGGATVSGVHQNENITVAASGKNLNINYEALDVNSTYAVVIPAGAVKSAEGDHEFAGEVKFTTCDFPATKAEGETHYGKAAATLPLSFAPFDAVAPFTTVGGLVQTSQNDYPHWVQASGGITADEAVISNTKDKVMVYFDGQSKYLYLNMTKEGDAGVTVKIQESRNCDIAPGWRTVRVLHANDFPFDACIALNPETRMVKILPESLSTSKIHVKAFALADAAGDLGPDFAGIANIIAGQGVSVNASNGTIAVTNVADGVAVNVYDIAGHLVGASHGESVFTLGAGLYIVKAGNTVVKVNL